MGAALKLLYAILIFGLLGKGFSGCSMQSLKLTQTLIGYVGRVPEYVVQVTNQCNCEQGNILVNCRGFNTAMKMDPSQFKKFGAAGTNCILNNGRPLGYHQTTNFKYAWDKPFLFTVVHSKMTC